MNDPRELRLNPLLAAALGQTARLATQMNAATSELNHVGQALARESQRRAVDHARFREELNSLKMGYDEFIGLSKRELVRMSGDRDTSKKQEERLKAMRDQQRLLEGQIANVEGLLRNAEAERDAERKEVASLRQQISLLQAQQGSTLEQAKRQVAEAEKEKNRVVEENRTTVPISELSALLVVLWQVSTHNDLLPEIFQVAEGSLVKTITSIATMVQAKNGKDQYPVSACVGCMMNIAAADAGRAALLSPNCSCVKWAMEMFHSARQRRDKETLWLVLCLISNLAVEREGVRQLLEVHVMAALKSLLGAEAEARVVDKCAEILTSLLSIGGLDAAQRRQMQSLINPLFAPLARDKSRKEVGVLVHLWETRHRDEY